MPTNIRCRARIRLSAIVFIVVAIFMIMLSGCNQKYGRFTLDDQVSQAFRSGTVQAELNYYYAGRDTMPYAIMGIDPRYTVPSRYWILFKPQPDQLKKMSGNVYGKHRYNPYGSHIRDAEGEVVGIWYSNLRFKSVSVDHEEKTVEVLFPNPEANDHASSAGGNWSTP